MLRLSATNNQHTNTIIHTHTNLCKATELSSILGPEAWKGRSCFLIGGGPSLRDPYFSTVISQIIAEGEITIGVNKSFLFGTTLCYAMDEQFYNLVTDPNNRELYRAWQTYGGMKVILRRSVKMKLDSGVYCVWTLDRKVISFDIKQGMYSGNNSGLGAMMLACALGCKKIGLLGYDLSIKDGNTHWHEGYQHQSAAQMAGPLVEFKLAIEEFADAWKINGIDIVNLNPHSALKCFRFATVEEFRAEINK